MKNKIVFSVLFLVTGLVVGNNLYSKIDPSVLSTFKESNEFFLLQEGIYNDKESMQNQTRDINPKVYEIKDDKYYVYVGITSNKDIAEKLKEIYKKNNIDVYIKNIKIKDKDFINNLNQFDILIESTNNPNEVLTIEEVVLSGFNNKILG